MAPEPPDPEQAQGQRGWAPRLASQAQSLAHVLIWLCSGVAGLGGRATLNPGLFTSAQAERIGFTSPAKLARITIIAIPNLTWELGTLPMSIVALAVHACQPVLQAGQTSASRMDAASGSVVFL